MGLAIGLLLGAILLFWLGTRQRKRFMPSMRMTAKSTQPPQLWHWSNRRIRNPAMGRQGWRQSGTGHGYLLSADLWVHSKRRGLSLYEPSWIWHRAKARHAAYRLLWTVQSQNITEYQPQKPVLGGVLFFIPGVVLLIFGVVVLRNSLWWWYLHLSVFCACLFKRKKPGAKCPGFLYNSLLLREAADPFAVIDKMEIHGILCAERIAAGNRIGNFTVAFYGFPAKDSPGCLHKQRNGTVDHRYQPWYNNVFAA